MTADQIADETNRCEWNPHMDGLRHDNPGAQAYYDSVVALYASWGVDFIKADDMLWPYQAADIEAFSLAIERSGRPIELSLSPGRDLSLTRLDHLREHATMWRICDDLWDVWEDVEANFARFARWAPTASEHGWPDGDMLPLGHIGIRAERGEPRDSRLTQAERVTLMTLWVIARSPLMIGGDLPDVEPGDSRAVHECRRARGAGVQRVARGVPRGGPRAVDGGRGRWRVRLGRGLQPRDGAAERRARRWGRRGPGRRGRSGPRAVDGRGRRDAPGHRAERRGSRGRAGERRDPGDH